MGAGMGPQGNQDEKHGGYSGYHEYHGWTQDDDASFAKQMEQARLLSLESSQEQGASSKEIEAGYGYGYGYRYPNTKVAADEDESKPGAAEIGEDISALAPPPPLPPKDEQMMYEKKMLDATAKWMDDTDSSGSITPPGSPEPVRGN
jgi:hypothetical protein